VVNEIVMALISLHISTVHLSFDDGPDPKYTEQVLTVLKENNLKANFFLVGERVLQYPKIAKRIVAEGHDIGGHTMTHKMLTKITLEEAKTEILKSMELVNQYQKTNLFRFSYGDFNKELLTFLKDNGLKNISWNLDTLDWKYKNKEEIYDKFKIKMVQSKDGPIILMHDIHSQSVEALKEIIVYLKLNSITVTKINNNNF